MKWHSFVNFHNRNIPLPPKWKPACVPLVEHECSQSLYLEVQKEIWCLSVCECLTCRTVYRIQCREQKGRNDYIHKPLGNTQASDAELRTISKGQLYLPSILYKVMRVMYWFLNFRILEQCGFWIFRLSMLILYDMLPPKINESYRQPVLLGHVVHWPNDTWVITTRLNTLR